MRPFSLVLVLFVLCGIAAQAQTILSLDAAIHQAMEKNIELQRRSADIRKSQAQLDESSLPPNPILGYSREDLKLNNAKVGEWIAIGSLPLNFLWERWSNIDSKRKSLEAQRLLFDHSRNDVIYQVQDAYLKSQYFSLLTSELDSALSTLDDVASASRQRTQNGDLSEYELQRILIEVNRLRADVKETEIQRNSHLSRLRLLIGYDPEKELQVAPFPAPPSPLQTDNELLRSALHNRKDLKAIERLIESESAFLSHSRLKGIPAIHFSAGYKQQLDQFSGLVLQLNVEVPLFRRNQSEIESTAAELSVLERQKEFLLKKIASEVNEASAKCRQYEGLHANQDDLRLHDILATAVYSYNQGQLSLVEFIDGLTAFTEGMKLRTDLEVKYRESIHELTRVSGASLFNDNQ